MTWFKVDDGFADHPKVDALLEGKHGEAALALWTLAGVWSAKHLQNGNVPAARVRKLGIKRAELAAAELVRVGLWHETADGFVFHEWAEHQPTREKVLAERARKAGNKRDSRARAGDKESTGTGESPETAAEVTAHVTGDQTSGHHVPSRPVPSGREERSESEAGASASSGFALQAEPPKGKRKRKVVVGAEAPVVEVFEHWRAAFGKTEGAILDANRAARIRWAIGAYGIETAKRAIDGCAANPWNRGANPSGKRYDDLTLIFRDASKTEGYAADAPVAGRPAAGPVRNIATSETVDVDAIARRIAENNARVRSA